MYGKGFSRKDAMLMVNTFSKGHTKFSQKNPIPPMNNKKKLTWSQSVAYSKTGE
jgi:hypothetical protein